MIFAYAGEPDRGSEPGAGWGIVRALAELVECVGLNGPEHTGGIQRWLKQHVPPAKFIEIPEVRGAALAKHHRTT